MIGAERRNIILEKLQEEKKVVVSELSGLFEVSEETIRRDLDRLDKEGLAVKSYGGATLPENNSSVDMPFMVRQKKNMVGKRKIAKLLAELINDGDHIIVDPSTTTLSMVREIKNKERLTIITNSIEVMIELNEQDGWDILSTGGQLKQSYLALVGPKTIESLKAFNADKVVFSCKGIDMEKGITDANELFSATKSAMLSSAGLKILAVDCTKFGNVAFSKICEVADMDMVVTDQKPDEAWLKYFKDKGIECIYEEDSDNSLR